MKNSAINCLTFEESTRQPYNDNLCLFRSLALHLHGNQRLQEEKSKSIKLFIKRMARLSANQFQGVHKNDITTVERLLTINNLLYDIDFVDEKLFGALAIRTAQKHGNNVRLLRYNHNFCYVSDINAVFQSFRRPNCDTISNKTSNLEQHLTSCSERVKFVFQRTFIKYS